MEPKYTIDNIEILEGGEAIRRRPYMYFDCFAKESLDSLAFEVACHAFDEYFDGKCSELKLTVDQTEAAVWYNAGVSLELSRWGETHAEAMMLHMYACSNLKKHLSVGETYCNSGMSAVNFASSNCRLTTLWEGQKGTFEFVDGKMVVRQIEPIESSESWTEITIKPSAEVFPGLQFTSAGIAERAAAIREELTGLNLVVDDRIG